MNSGDVLEICESVINSSEQSIIQQVSSTTRMEDVERQHIISILDQTNWQVHGDKGAAKILDMNPSTLRTRMAKLGIKKKTVEHNQ